ncbi:MAG TPA: gamma-glutamylcyclotransferase [Burkholderiales bacterium]|jgi:cation transport protein ChaC|nr:gamma-glutamylcyclotransferase [Burkholderiales bacterium]
MSKFGWMKKYLITRESLLDGSHHARVRAGQGPHVRYMTDEERNAHIAEMLARAPKRGSVWVFGYGSLMWNPAFHFVERHTARVHGFHRQFCLWARGGRGSAERPGLMLSLESGGSCTGVAYRIAPEAAAAELDVLWRREMSSWSYRPVWVTAHLRRGPVPAIVFAVNRSHERYVPGLDTETIARYLATGAGLNGSCREYLFDTAEHLLELGIRDRRIEALAHRVRDLRPDEEPPSP